MKSGALIIALLLPSLCSAATLRWGALETATVHLDGRTLKATLQRVAMDTTAMRVHGMLLLVRDPKSGLVWWYCLRDRQALSFDFIRTTELNERTFATDGERIVAFGVRMPDLAARAANVRARSLDEARRLLTAELKESLARGWPATSEMPPPAFVRFPLAAAVGSDFLRPLHPHETQEPVSIESAAFEHDRWKVVLKNERGQRATLRFTPGLKLIGGGEQ